MNDQFATVLDRFEQAVIQLTYQRAEISRLRDEAGALQQKIDERGHTPRPDDVIEMIRALADGRKIEAIKYYRTLTGYGLKESKDAIETVMRPHVASVA